MLAVYVSGHGFGHATRVGEVLRALREREPRVPLAIVSAAPEDLFRRAVPGPFDYRAAACDVGLVQHGALAIDEAATAERCRAFAATWDARVSEEAAWLRASSARLALGDIPPLAFAAAARAGVASIGLGNFSWDWIYARYAGREPDLAQASRRAAESYRHARLLLELPFAGDLRAFPHRERIGFVARRPQVARDDARRRLGLDARPAVLLSFGGIGLEGLPFDVLAAERGLQCVTSDARVPDGLVSATAARLDALGLSYVDVVGACDVVVTKPGYGIVSDALGAGARLVYTERGDFPEYEVMIDEMPRYLACAHVSNADLRAGRIAEAVGRALTLPQPEPPDLGGAARAAARLLETLA